MNGPLLWADLLADCPKRAVLMGGAVVDYVAAQWGVGNGEPKDYDIFYPYKPGLPDMPEGWEYQVPDVAEAAHQAEYVADVDHKHPIGAVYTYKVGFLKVQLIGLMLPDPRDYFKMFDHSLTLGYYTKSGMFVHKRVFDSLVNQQITFVAKDRGPKQKIKSYKRAINKLEHYHADLHEWELIGFE